MRTNYQPPHKLEKPENFILIGARNDVKEKVDKKLSAQAT